MMDSRGSAALLAFFTIFVIISSLVAVYLFERGYGTKLGAIEMRIASDATRAVLKSVETELNQTLKTSVEAAMYRLGRAGREKGEITVAARESFNTRIRAGWSYHNFQSISVPLSDENTLHFEWLPDGSLQATGYLDVVVTHLTGVKGFGAELSSGVVPRYGRMWYLANRAYEEATGGKNPQQVEDEFNEKYSCELFTFSVESVEGSVRVTVKDDYAGRALAG